MPNVDGKKTPQDYVEEGWFQVFLKPGDEPSEELDSKGHTGTLEVRPEVWRMDGVQLSDGTDEAIGKAVVDGKTVKLEGGNPLSVDLVVVARFAQGDEPEVESRTTPMAPSPSTSGATSTRQRITRGSGSTGGGQ